MGLDAYIFSYDSKDIPDDGDVDVKIPKDIKPHELFYWRKHHALHDYMERIYYNKGGSDPMFNCVKVRLHEEDLDDLEKQVMSKILYDRPDANESYFDEDVEFILLARKALKENKKIYYDSWW